VVAVKEMAKQLGYVPPEDHSVALAQRDAALARIETLEQELRRSSSQIAAIDVIGRPGSSPEEARPEAQATERSAA
jgi:hypothetical protein